MTLSLLLRHNRASLNLIDGPIRTTVSQVVTEWVVLCPSTGIWPNILRIWAPDLVRTTIRFRHLTFDSHNSHSLPDSMLY